MVRICIFYRQKLFSENMANIFCKKVFFSNGNKEKLSLKLVVQRTTTDQSAPDQMTIPLINYLAITYQSYFFPRCKKSCIDFMTGRHLKTQFCYFYLSLFHLTKKVALTFWRADLQKIQFCYFYLSLFHVAKKVALVFWRADLQKIQFRYFYLSKLVSNKIV